VWRSVVDAVKKKFKKIVVVLVVSLSPMPLSSAVPEVFSGFFFFLSPFPLPVFFSRLIIQLCPRSEELIVKANSYSNQVAAARLRVNALPHVQNSLSLYIYILYYHRDTDLVVSRLDWCFVDTVLYALRVLSPTLPPPPPPRPAGVFRLRAWNFGDFIMWTTKSSSIIPMEFRNE